MESLFIKRAGSLWPLDEAILHGIPDDTVIKCKWTRPRHGKHHRLFFVLLKMVYENQTLYIHPDHMREDILISIGHCEFYINAKGETRARALSISWGAMGQDEFNVVFNKVVDFIVEKILPGIDKAALTAEVYNLAGIPMALLEMPDGA